MSDAPAQAASFVSAAASAAATLYERPAGSAGPGWVAFVAFAADQPATLTLADTWSNYLGEPLAGRNGGTYVVAAARPADPAAYLDELVEAVIALNDKAGGFAYRYLFFGDPTSGSPSTLPGVIPFATTSPDRGQPGRVRGQGGGKSQVATRNVGLTVAYDANIFCDTSTSSLRLAANGTAGIELLATKYVPKNISSLDTPVSLPLDGPTGGTLCFGLKLTVSADPGKDDFTFLDVGLKYFTERDGRILSMRYPLFGPPEGGAAVPFDVSYDPLRPLDHDRTAFTFRPPAEGGDCPAMASALRDGFAHPVRMVPRGGASELVLQEDRVAIQSTTQQRDFYYLAPSGPFGLAGGGSKPPASRVMCGLSSLETVVFDPPGSEITFHPDASAFSPLLTSTAPGGDAPRLDDRYRTAWATITTAAAGAVTAGGTAPAPVYLAQAEGAALFGHGDDADAPYLVHRETPAAVLHDPSSAGAFPLAAYGQIIFGAHPDTFDTETVARLEKDVLAVERRARIAAVAGGRTSRASLAGTAFAAEPTTSVTAVTAVTAVAPVTTPQGFLLGLAPDGSGAWDRLHLAQTSWSPDPGRLPPTTSPLAFGHLDDTLRGAFQTNQQFLVVTEPAVPWNLSEADSAATTTFEDVLRPQGWPFHIRVGSRSFPNDYRNVLIFKFCDGSLDARIDDFAGWTAAEAFNADPADVAIWLRGYIDQAKALRDGPDGAYFEKFVEAVTTDSWRGILALRVDVDLSAMPQELRGLAAGIDRDGFNAHHVGIDLSYVDTAEGTLRADGNSSLFATVYYLDAVYAAGLEAGAPPELPTPVVGQPDYAFRVLSLKTLFANAEIVAFASKAQVTVNKVFGDQVSSLTLGGIQAPSNSLVLDGTYENHDGTGVYVFGTDADARFILVSNLWRSVEILRASFSTLRSDDVAVLSRFGFQGFMDFASVSADNGTSRAPFDVLSFGGTGDGADSTGTGLPFAELHLDMEFATASPATPSFTFATDQMSFAPTVDRARSGSLYARMPLTLTGLVSGTSSPSDLGYLPVSPLSLPTEPLGDQWYALAYTLDLGTGGALAATTGFTARLLVAWSAQSQGNGYRLALGLSLPGAGGGTTRGLSLQGVLKLTVGQILLYRDAKADTFVLRLTNVLLSLLGISLPPSTSTAFIVFGNPDPGLRDTVGWYAAVNREPKTPTTLTAPAGGL